MEGARRFTGGACKGGPTAKVCAQVAVAHALLVAIHHMFDERQREQSTRRAVRQLQHLGFNITVEELEARRYAA